MFVPFEIILLIIFSLVVFKFVLVPVFRPLFGRSWEDKQLRLAEKKNKNAQKLLRAAELEAKALETEVKADEVRENALLDKLK